MDEKAFGLWDLPPIGEVTLDYLQSRIHPSDQDRVRATFSATRATITSERHIKRYMQL